MDQRSVSASDEATVSTGWWIAAVKKIDVSAGGAVSKQNDWIFLPVKWCAILTIGPLHQPATLETPVGPGKTGPV